MPDEPSPRVPPEIPPPGVPAPEIPGPEIPLPGREPGPAARPVVPVVELPDADPWHRLADRRTVLVSGPLDAPAADRLAAQLMALDGDSRRPVELLVTSDGGGAAHLGTLLDVLDLMRAPVGSTCLGLVAGTAAVLAACCPGQRRAVAHARISLRCHDRASVEGTSDDLVRHAAELTALRERVIDALVTASGQPTDVMAHEVDRGDVHSAREALDLGIIDAIGRPGVQW